MDNIEFVNWSELLLLQLISIIFGYDVRSLSPFVLQNLPRQLNQSFQIHDLTNYKLLIFLLENKNVKIPDSYYIENIEFFIHSRKRLKLIPRKTFQRIFPEIFAFTFCDLGDIIHFFGEEIPIDIYFTIMLLINFHSTDSMEYQISSNSFVNCSFKTIEESKKNYVASIKPFIDRIITMPPQEYIDYITPILTKEDFSYFDSSMILCDIIGRWKNDKLNWQLKNGKVICGYSFAFWFGLSIVKLTPFDMKIHFV